MELQNMLESIGMSQNEISVYMLLLHGVEKTGKELLNESMMEKSSLYRALNGLMDKGFVGAQGSIRKQRFFAEPRKRVIHAYEQKIAEIENSKKMFESVAQEIEKYAADTYKSENVVIITGKNAYDNYHKALLLPGVKTLRDLASSKVNHHVGETFENVKKTYEWYIPERVRRGIQIQVLYGKSDVPDEFDISNKKLLKECRRYPENLHLPSVMTISEKFVAFCTTKNNKFWGIIIKDVLVAKLLWNVYDILWNQSTVI